MKKLEPSLTDRAFANDISADVISPDPWRQLRRFTRARIALGRAGSSLPTHEVLDFGMAHAMARDAVHLALDQADLSAQLKQAGHTVLTVQSQAQDRGIYLLRPDLGRHLAESSVAALQAAKPARAIDLLLVLGDGLSALAINRHAIPLLEEIKRAMPAQWQAGPVVIASQARVALADEIGQHLNARMVAILIGERPGLSSPDSLGIYLTFAPRSGRSDAERNCISNVRPEGLAYAEAARKLLWLASAASRQQQSGVVLKDESDMPQLGGDD